MFNCDSSNITLSNSECTTSSADSSGCISTTYRCYYNLDPNEFSEEDSIIPNTNFVERFVFKKVLRERRKQHKFYFKKNARRNRLIGKREKRIGLRN